MAKIPKSKKTPPKNNKTSSGSGGGGVTTPTDGGATTSPYADEGSWNRARITAQGKWDKAMQGKDKALQAKLKGELNTIRGGKGKYSTPTTPATPPPTTETPGFTFSAEDQKRIAPTLGMNYNDWLGTTNGAFETTNRQAQDELSRRLAGTGQLGGGNELKQAADTSNQVSAAFVDKFNNARQSDIDNFSNWYSTNANLTQQERESLRNSMLTAAQIAAGQSNNAAALAATQQGASATTAYGNQKAGNTMSGASGGGGGGGPPVQNNANSYLATLYQTLGNGATQGFWGNLGKNLWGA